jgi:hypothetical protein
MKQLKALFKKMVWKNAYCSSYFEDGSGRIVAVYPGSVGSYKRLVAQYSVSLFEKISPDNQ